MSIYELLSVIIAVIALVVSIASYLKATSIALANIELYMNERITNTKERVGEISLQMASLVSKAKKSSEEERQLEVFQRAFRAAVESNLNAYEEACAKYLDNKVDKKRFEKNYKVEIRQLVENEELKEYFDAVKSRYKAILKVYDLWENLEK